MKSLIILKNITTRKKGFNEGYLAKVTLRIDLLNRFFITFLKFQRLF